MPECVARRSLVNSAERNGERAENDRQRQGPEAELDFQRGPGGTADDEPDDAGEGHTCTASDFGEFVCVSLAAGEHRQIESQLSYVRRHYRGRWRVLQSKLHQYILRRHGGDAEHSRENCYRTVDIGKTTEPDTEPKKPGKEYNLKQQQWPQQGRPGPCRRAGRQRDQSHHRHEDRDREERSDLAETAGDVVRGHDDQVASDVGGKQPAKRKKADDINRAGRRAQDGREQPGATKMCVSHDVIDLRLSLALEE